MTPQARPILPPAGWLFLPLWLFVSACAGAAPQARVDEPAGGDPLARVSAEELFERGRLLAQRGDPVRAEQYLSAAIKRGFPEGKALPLLLHVCLQSQRLGAALHYAEPYLKLHPDDVNLRYLISSVHLGLGRPGRAHQELSRVLSIAPDHAAAHYLRGAIARDHGDDPERTAEDFEAYARLAPEGVHALEVSAWLRGHRQQAERESNEPEAAPARSDAPHHAAPVRLDAEAPE